MPGRVDGERMQLVQGHALPPPDREGVPSVVRGEDAVEERAAEQREHREVGLAVAAVRRGIDEHDTIGRPQDVAGPQVAVEPGGSVVVVVERSGGDQRDRPRTTSAPDAVRFPAATAGSRNGSTR